MTKDITAKTALIIVAGIIVIFFIFAITPQSFWVALSMKFFK
jgi:hypothetical protein